MLRWPPPLGIIMCHIGNVNNSISKGRPYRKANVLGIDLAKNVFQLCALNKANKVIVNFKVARNELLNKLR